MTEKVYDYLDFYKVDLMVYGITQTAFCDWANVNDISEVNDYFWHPQIAGLVYFVDEDIAAACKLLATKYDESVEVK